MDGRSAGAISADAQRERRSTQPSLTESVRLVLSHFAAVRWAVASERHQAFLPAIFGDSCSVFFHGS
jgi:hypothetical protein